MLGKSLKGILRRSVATEYMHIQTHSCATGRSNIRKKFGCRGRLVLVIASSKAPTQSQQTREFATRRQRLPSEPTVVAPMFWYRVPLELMDPLATGR